MAESPRSFALDNDPSPRADATLVVDHPSWPRARSVRVDELVRAGTATQGGFGDLVPTTTKIGPTTYEAHHRDLVRCDPTGGVVDVQLPATAGTDQWVKVVDVAGTAGSPFAIRLLPVVGDTVLGQTDHYRVDLENGSVYVVLLANSDAWLAKEE